MAEIITFRTHLLGSINDFSESCAMGQLVRSSLLVELIFSLAHYTEEGTRLAPEVYLCNSLEAVLKMLPGSGRISIGQSQLNEQGIRQALKKCAPLATGGWSIYIESAVDEENLTYGLFHGSLSPLSVSVEEAVLTSNEYDAVRLVRVQQTAEGCVEIRNHLGNRHNIFLSHHQEDSAKSPDYHLDELIQSICSSVEPNIKDSVITFLKKAAQKALIDCNGSLIVVTSQRTAPMLLSDGIILSNPIDFPALVQAARDEKQYSQLELLSNAEILQGMINSDGIVVFNPFGMLLGYNCFVASSQRAVTVTGGARRRAFETLNKRLGHGLSAVFMRSHDGLTEYRSLDNDEK